MANRISKYYDEHGKLIPPRSKRASMTAEDWLDTVGHVPASNETGEMIRQVLDKYMAQYLDRLQQHYVDVTGMTVSQAAQALHSKHHGEHRIRQSLTVTVSGKKKTDPEIVYTFSEYDLLRVNWEIADKVYNTAKNRIDTNTADDMDRKLWVLIHSLKTVDADGIVLWRMYADTEDEGRDCCTFALCDIVEEHKTIRAKEGFASSMSAITLMTLVKGFYRVGQLGS